MFAWVLKKMFGSKNERELRRLAPRVDAINALEAELKKLSDDALREKTAEFRRQIDKGAPLDDLIAPAFATVREASRRVLGMRHYDVQLIGGMVLHEGKVAEMRTGEGKTLVATLPVYLNALEGRGVHVVTVNDYLAGRDAEWMGRLYGFLGMSTGVIRPRQSNEQKKRAYGCDVTYGQNNEFGFDYLRDNMKFSIHEYVQRELRYAIVDEVDSILIDEARTPLIISGQGSSASQKYVQIDEIIPRLRKDEHFEVDEKARSCSLTEEGVEYAQKLLTDKGLLEVMPGKRVGNLYDPTNLETLHIMQQCLRAHALYHRDKQYMVGPDQKVLIIDEHTGRTLPGRRWSDGLHQAVEAKERVAIEEESITLATISFQNLFRLYNKLSGMTGTAETEASEFHQIYKLDVLTIPTNKPISRKDAEDLVYKTEREKFKAIVEEIKDARTKGQPVLVGTTSVEKSDALASQLARAGVPHNVLNAKQHEREAYVVAQAGMRGAVTVATNMAGRGTDILLGGNPEMLARLEVMQKLTPEDAANKAVFDAAIVDATKHYVDHCKEEGKAIRAAGGLRIIGTERHESRRIDNQLRGRAGRQGDPGESRFYLSLEDDLMRIFAGDRVQMMMDRLGMEEDVPIEHEWVTRAVENAQKKVEERNFDIRKHLLEYDDVMNQQRKGVYALRRQVLCGQYRSVPTDEEAKAGKVPEPRVQKADEKLAARVKPILEQMVKLHAAEPPAVDATNEEVIAFRDRALAANILTLTNVRYQSVERDVYTWFGCVVDLRKVANEPRKLLELLEAEVALSLTEQRERMLDLVDEMIGGMVTKHCPKDAHWEDWDRDGLARVYQSQFQIPCRPLDKAIDAQTITEQLYADAEAVLLRKEKDFGPENLLRLFRNIYLEEIDRQWIDHLQAMDNLRDGINLRAFGQRDPKKEFKREGFFMFQNMMATITSSVAGATFSLKHASEEDMQRLEAQRRRDAEIRAGGAGAHPATAQQQAEAAAAASEAARALTQGTRASSPSAAPAARTSLPAEQPKPVPVRREAPKIGRNDPCYCGSGKKYKACHYREDQSASGR